MGPHVAGRKDELGAHLCKECHQAELEDFRYSSGRNIALACSNAGVMDSAAERIRMDRCDEGISAASISE